MVDESEDSMDTASKIPAVVGVVITAENTTEPNIQQEISETPGMNFKPPEVTQEPLIDVTQESIRPEDLDMHGAEVGAQDIIVGEGSVNGSDAVDVDSNVRIISSPA